MPPDQQPAGARRFIGAIAADSPARLAWVMAVQVAGSLTQGIGLLLLIPLLQLAGVGGEAARRGPLRWTSDAFAAVGVRPTLRTVLAAWVAAVALGAVLAAYRSVLVVRYRLEFVDRLRNRLYRAVARAQWQHLLSLRRSDVLSDLTVSVNFVGQGVLAVLTLAVTAIVVAVQLAVAVRISVPITALATATGILLAVMVSPLVSRSRRLGRELVDNTRDVLATTTGFLDGLQLAKTHGMESSHVRTFDQAVHRTRDSQIAYAAATARANALQLIVSAGVMAVLVLVAIERFQAPLAELVVLAFIFARIVPQIVSFQQQLHHGAQALPAYQKVMELVSSCEGSEERPPTRDVAPRLDIGSGVRLDNVSFRYPSAVTDALQHVTLEVPSKRTTALVGPSGGGKTTLAALAVGLLTPSAGTVIVDREPLDGDRVSAWRAAVGVVPQEPFLFHDTIRSNLAWAEPDAPEAQMWAALATAAAADFVAALPDGLDTVVGDRGMRLSGGERQRIALARALLRSPDLLVLDEATSALDSEHERAIRDALAALQGEVTMLVIAHRLSTVSHADNVVVIDGGRVAETGTWEELAQRQGGRLHSLVAAGALQ
jgi:ATP-binding cassette subfamily C protein